MIVTVPGSGGIVHIPPTGEPPPLPFATTSSGDHHWAWRLLACGVATTGTTRTPHGRWDARGAVGPAGGDLTVGVTAGGVRAAGHVGIRGSNPAAAAIVAYLHGRPGAAGFDRIVVHESRCRQFDDGGLPLKSFDGGVGLCQLTHPPCTAHAAWDWRANLDAGLALFAAKRRLAERHLGQAGRPFTAAQAVREAVCLWNGGFYHVWDGGEWARPATLLCDPAAGNIGWDTTDPTNRGRSAADLHARDAATYARGHGAHWRYSGVCYADHLLG